MMSVSRTLRHSLHLHSLIARKGSCVSVWRSFPLDCTRPTDKLFPLFVGLLTVIFQRHETHMLFFSEKNFLGLRGTCFYCFRAKPTFNNYVNILTYDVTELHVITLWETLHPPSQSYKKSDH
jgi:hypothetical protein